MGNGIEFQPNGQTPGVIQNPELPVEHELQLIEYLLQASGDENGAIFFNLDWQNQRAEQLRQTLATIYGATPNEQNNSDNQTNPTWRDLINLAREHEDFKEFRRSPENFWQQVRQMSEPKIVRDDDGNETRTTSRFDKLLSDMKAQKMSLREFVQTLPPNERAAFKANYQLRQTFGANVFNGDGVTLSDAGQTRLREVSIDMSRAAGLREGEAALKSLLSGNAPAARGETMFGAKSAALPGASVPANQNSNGAATGNPTLQNTAPAAIPQTALGSAVGANSILAESSVAQNLTNAASENKTNASAAAQRDSGTVIGGALISGAFAAVENYQNFADNKIGGSRAGENNFGAGGGFAAGATGAMFGATVGTVVPGAGTVVSGVLGFVSSVVVGVEVDQGLRWLGAGMTFDATAADGANANNQKQLTTGDSLMLPDANLQLAPA